MLILSGIGTITVDITMQVVACRKPQKILPAQVIMPWLTMRGMIGFSYGLSEKKSGFKRGDWMILRMFCISWKLYAGGSLAGLMQLKICNWSKDKNNTMYAVSKQCSFFNFLKIPIRHFCHQRYTKSARNHSIFQFQEFSDRQDTIVERIQFRPSANHWCRLFLS